MFIPLDVCNFSFHGRVLDLHLRTPLVVLVYAFEDLWMWLWKNRKNLISHSLRSNDSMACVSGF
jgi:hypothetical protein